MVIVFAILTVVGFIAILVVIRKVLNLWMGGGVAVNDPAREAAELIGNDLLTDDERAALRKRSAEKFRRGIATQTSSEVPG